MYKKASRNLQRRREKAQSPRRGLKSGRPKAGAVVSMSPSTALRIGAGFGPGVRDEITNRMLEREADKRLREAPVASAPVAGERARDLERLAEIQLRQKKAAKQRKRRAGKRPLPPK